MPAVGYCPQCGDDRLAKNGSAESGRQRYKCRLGHKTTSPLKTLPGGKKRKGLTTPAAELRKAQVFVVTAAQNNTDLHPAFWRSLQTYVQARGAQLLVIPIRYRNTDAFHQEADAEFTWPDEVMPYLLDRDLVINDNLIIMGDAKITATADTPLSGFEALSGMRSAIYGHAQVQMEMVATPSNVLPKMLHTTGTVSKRNYTRSKAGKKASFHHTNAAVVIEVVGGRFWLRELIADGKGGFYDLDAYYAGDAVTRGHRAEALVLGDEHVKFLSPSVKAATWGPGGIVPTLKPKVLVRHDIHDHYSQSHHHEADTILKVRKANAGDWRVKEELDLTVQHLVETTPAGCQSLVIESNHHSHLYRWLNRFDANKDPHNAVFAWELQGKLAEAIKTKREPDPFRIYIESALPETVAKRVRFVGANDAALIKDIDVSQHGDRGANGSRPSQTGFAKTARKMVVAHGHSPWIRKGCSAVGVSATGLDYAKGLSSWMHTHCVIYPNGKRAMLHIVGDGWRGSVFKK